MTVSKLNILSAPIILITMSIDESHIYAVIRFIAIVIYCLSLVRKSRSLKLGETLNAIIGSTEGDMCRQQKESFAALTQHKACIDAFLCG